MNRALLRHAAFQFGLCPSKLRYCFAQTILHFVIFPPQLRGRLLLARQARAEVVPRPSQHHQFLSRGAGGSQLFAVRALGTVRSRFRRFELAVAHCVRGDREAADAALADLIANAREGFAYQIAEVYALRGEKDKAFEWLQTALDDRDAGMLGLLVDPLLRGLHDDPRYKSFLAKLGLPSPAD